MSDSGSEYGVNFSVAQDAGRSSKRPGIDRLILGKRLKHFRKQAGLTLDQLGARVGLSTSQLSLYENGKREPKLSTLQEIARELNTDIQKLFATEAPNKRSALEIALEQMQRTATYRSLGLPQIRSAKSLTTDSLEVLVGLGRELHRQAQQKAATVEGAKQANTLIREKMRAQNNHIAEIEKIAEDLMLSVGHTGGALTHRTVDVLANKLGFSLVFVDDLPSNTRSITDLENGRIYLPPASFPGGHGLRALALQAMAHRVLGHETPWDYAQFLQQRLEINYFSSACLMPRTRTVEFLQNAKQDRNLAIEDLRDAFGVTHEAAAHRFTNLATEYLDLNVHFYRTSASGALVRGYQNDGLGFPSDEFGNEEGQIVCKHWPGRVAFKRKNRTNEYYQYIDTPQGTFWSAVQTGESEADGRFSITCGVGFDDAKYFRGRETQKRSVSLCPAEECCKRPDELLAERWEGRSWASARMHQYVLAPLPTGTFPGVDESEMYEFLTRHDDEFKS